MTARRIEIFVPYIDAFGGVERLIVALSRHLHDRGLVHAIVCFRQTIDFGSHATWPMEIRELRPARNAISEGRALSRHFRRSHDDDGPLPLFFDLKSAFYAGLFHCSGFHLHLTDPPSLLPADVSKFSRSNRATYLKVTRGQVPTTMQTVRGELVHQINRRGVKRARSLMAMTYTISDELRSLYKREAKIIRPGVPQQTPRPSRPNFGLKPIHLLSVSRLEKNKRLDWVFNALASLESADVPLGAQCEWLLDVVGDGSQTESLRELAQKLGIGSKVIFHGRVSDEAVERLFSNASLFLLPAVQGYGLPALEALARAVPVVLHRESGVSEILGQSPWIERIEQGPDDLAAAIRTMIGNISSGEIAKYPLPRFPSDTEWAEEISRNCGWI